MLRYPGLTGNVTVANFPPVDSAATAPETQFVYLTWSDGDAWHMHNLGELAPGRTAMFREDQLPPDIPGDALPVFFLYPDRLPDKLEKLMQAATMNTSPAWRANISLSGAASTAGYQGEYPDGMLDLPKASLMSFGPFLQAGNDLQTSCLLVNLQAGPGLDEATVSVATLRDQKILKNVKAHRNRCTVIELTEFAEYNNELLCIFSRDMTGIPLYISHDSALRELSLEHSHPPAELVIFGNRNKIQGHMKNWWLEHLHE